jgi:hypothetical protein
MMMLSFRASCSKGPWRSSDGTAPAVDLGDGRGRLPLSLPIPYPGGNRPEG